MSLNFESNITSTFGFHSGNTLPIKRYVYIPSSFSDSAVINCLNFIGWIPVLGVIPCIVRLILPLTDKDSFMHYETSAVKTANYIRGAFEGLGLGAVYIIPDLLVTAYRFCTAEERSPENLRRAGFRAHDSYSTIWSRT